MSVADLVPQEGLPCILPGEDPPAGPGETWMDAYSGWIYRRRADGSIAKCGPTREQHLADMMKLRLHRARWPKEDRRQLHRRMGWTMRYLTDVEAHLAEWERSWISETSHEAVTAQVVGRLEAACEMAREVGANPDTPPSTQLRAVQTFMQGQMYIFKVLQEAGAAPKAAERLEVMGRVGVLHGHVVAGDPEKLKDVHMRAANFIMKYVDQDGSMRVPDVDQLLDEARPDATEAAPNA